MDGKEAVKNNGNTSGEGNTGGKAESRIDQGLQSRAAGGSGTPTANPSKMASTSVTDPNATVTNPPEGGAVASGGQSDGGPSSDDELSQLRERVKTLEAAQDSLQKKREAADAVDSYIREEGERLPHEMLRELLPQTTDRNALMQKREKITKWLRSIIEAEVKAGNLRFVNKFDNGGGESVAKHVPVVGASPSQLIGAGLVRANRQRLGS